MTKIVDISMALVFHVMALMFLFHSNVDDAKSAMIMGTMFLICAKLDVLAERKEDEDG